MGHHDRTVWLPRTLPVRDALRDRAPYHWTTNQRGNLSLQPGPSRRDTTAAAAEYMRDFEQPTALETLLDTLGVPK